MELNTPNFKQTFDVRFEFYNNNKVVICYVSPKRQLEYVSGYLNARGEENFISTSDADFLFNGSWEWKGVAVLHPEDNCDVELGKKIALKKAMRGYYHEVATSYKKVWKEIALFAAERLDYLEKAEAKASELNLEILELVKD